MLRKVRGLLGVGLTWGTLWGAIMATIGFITMAVDPDSIDPGEHPLIIGAIVGMLGFVSGVSFGAILTLAEKRRTLRELSPWRAALWGALGAVALPLLTPMSNTLALIVAPLGAAFASASVAIARRAALRQGDQQRLLAVDDESPDA
jgi:hypothetical protein